MEDRNGEFGLLLLDGDEKVVFPSQATENRYISKKKWD